MLEKVNLTQYFQKVTKKEQDMIFLKEQLIQNWIKIMKKLGQIKRDMPEKVTLISPKKSPHELRIL